MRPTMLLCGFVAVTAAGAAADPVGNGPAWVYDVVSLTNGSSFRGLILKESETGIDFQVVRRLPGRPTVTLTTSFLKREIAVIKRLSEAERKLLIQRLAELDPLLEGERQRMESLDLMPSDWLGQPNRAWQYESDQFRLISGAPEEISRRVAVRLEQIYAALTRLLPPRQTAARPTMIYLAGTMADYRKLLGPRVGPLLNPAIYEPETNRIVCGSDLIPLGEMLAQKRVELTKQRQELNQYEQQVRKLYRNAKPELDRFLEKVTTERKRLREAGNANEAAFEQATRRLFALLFHESFHSYTNNYVYPARGPIQMPLWLNEGLAQIVETAILDGSELRIDHADVARLNRARHLLKSDVGLMPMEELLRAGPTAFLVAHSDQQAAADRAYLSCWAAMLYLTFERRVVGTPEFERFLSKAHSPKEVLVEFKTWTGLEPKQFDQELHTYLRKINADGSLFPK